jgi:transposase
MELSATITRIKTMLPHLNEKQKRLFLATEANALGYGGVSQVSKISGVSRVTITQGLRELENPDDDIFNIERCRREGGGRKRIDEIYPEIKDELEKLLESYTKGNPENPLKWTSKSMRNLESALRNKGYEISDTTIGDLLKEMGFSLQANRKDLAIKPSHPDRNLQFEYINAQVHKYIENGQPVISIDTKKKENIGNFENKGAEYSRKKEATKVLDHDFPIEGLGKAVPYGVYDILKNTGFVNVGISNDTAEFAVESIRRWWELVGSKYYPSAKRLLITADCGGSNGYRVRLWKVKLQEISNALDLEITVSHFPPGTSKWNKIEHKLFSFISKNWRGKPLLDLAVIINLIAATTTEKGLVVDCVFDDNVYLKGIKVPDNFLELINITRHDFHGEWNYTISPQYDNL